MSEILCVNTPNRKAPTDAWVTFACSCGNNIHFYGRPVVPFKCENCGQEYQVEDLVKFFFPGLNGTIVVPEEFLGSVFKEVENNE